MLSRVIQRPRKAEKYNLPKILELAKEFHSYSIYKNIPFDEDATWSFIEDVIDRGVIFFTDTGFVGGLIHPTFFNPSVLVATEIVWYSPGGGGKELREYFEAWAGGRGVSMVQFSALVSGDLDKVKENLTKNDYKLTELAFVKRLK